MRCAQALGRIAISTHEVYDIYSKKCNTLSILVHAVFAIRAIGNTGCSEAPKRDPPIVDEPSRYGNPP
jgi:hypothetical protein